MIQGFEKQTCPLDDYERTTLLPVMVRCLKTKTGRENAVCNGEMCDGLREHGYTISEARVRKIINHIRTNNLITGLMATSDGYYVTEDTEEMEKYIKSLDGRISAIAAVRDAMVQQLRFLYEEDESTDVTHS